MNYSAHPQKRNSSKSRVIYLKLICITILGFFILFPATTESLSSSDHIFNPALFSISHRSLFELDINIKASVSNNYLSSSDFFTEQIIIDINEMYEKLKEPGLQCASRELIESHFLFFLEDISAGLYMTMDGLAKVTVPGDFIGLLAEGNEIDETYSGSSDLYCHFFLEAGLYAGYKWRNFQFGTKLGIFSPIAYCDNGTVEYNLTTDSSTGITSFNSSLNARIYSAINFTDNSTYSFGYLLGTMDGVNIDLGAIYMEEDKAICGVHLNNIPVKPARTKNENTVSFSTTGTINNPLSNFDNEEEMFTEDSKFEVTSTEAEKDVSMPIGLGGFYCLTFLPIIDILFKGDLVFADLFMYSLGIVVEGDFRPFPSVYTGIGYNRIAWETFLGVRMDVRFVEIDLTIGLTAPDFCSMFAAKGFSAALSLIFGY